MARGISVALPLLVDETDGPYRLNKTLEDLARQNLKMLLLTIPGERIMLPDYGAGLSRYIFENKTTSLNDNIIGTVTSQIQKHLSYISLVKIELSEPADRPNTISVLVEYYIPNQSLVQRLTFDVGII